MDTLFSQSARKIQVWWKKHSSICNLRKIVKYINSNLTQHDLQELSNKCASISNTCMGDGAGLLGGCLIDMLVGEYFKSKLLEYSAHHKGESDMKICGISLSQKKINGKSIVALDWSKNKTIHSKEQFAIDIMIINLKTEKWWKTSPKNIQNKKIDYTDTIQSGIYLVDKQYCKKYVKLSSNNKTNSLIESHQLYCMLKRSLSLNTFIDLPLPNQCYTFTLMNAFS